ncbi:MAG TPA: hypothetical protein VFY97_00355 [Rhodanobacteraceae bacterium]|nr:hypothetical protein [Rhodanobacteraceae bacterium]
MQILEENRLAFSLRIAFMQIEVVRAHTDDVRADAHAREALFSRPGFDCAEQRGAYALPARTRADHQRGELDEWLGGQQASWLGVRESAYLALRIHRDQQRGSGAPVGLAQPPRNRLRIRRIAELAGQHRQGRRIVNGRFANQP